MNIMFVSFSLSIKVNNIKKLMYQKKANYEYIISELLLFNTFSVASFFLKSIYLQNCAKMYVSMQNHSGSHVP